MKYDKDEGNESGEMKSVIGREGMVVNGRRREIKKRWVSISHKNLMKNSKTCAKTNIIENVRI